MYRDAETGYLDLIPDEDDAMSGIIGASVTYRLAFGPHALTARRTVPAFDTTTLTSANADGDGFGWVIQVQSAKHHA